MLEQDRPQEAIKIFRRAMTEHPDLPVAFYYYGRLALQLNEGSIDDTISVLRKAVAMEPSFADSHYELGRALEQAGKVDEAIPEFEKCLQLTRRCSEPNIAWPFFIKSGAMRKRRTSL